MKEIKTLKQIQMKEAMGDICLHNSNFYKPVNQDIPAYKKESLSTNIVSE